MMRDAEFGMIRIRAFGVFAFRVKDPEVFLKEVFGTNGMFAVEDVEGQIKRTLISGLSDAIAESKIPALDMAANYQELSDFVQKALNPKVETLGLTLTSFIIENISLPEDVEKALDKRTSMGIAGDLNKYTQYQAAEAMREAANNQGGGGHGRHGCRHGSGRGDGADVCPEHERRQPAANRAAGAGRYRSLHKLRQADSAGQQVLPGMRRITDSAGKNLFQLRRKA